MDHPLPTRRRTLLARAPLVVYVAAVGVLVARLHRVPASRELLILLVVGGIVAASATSLRRLRRAAAGFMLDWLPFAGMLSLYDLIRGYADGLWLPAHARPQIEADRILGAGSIPTVWLQRRLWHGPAHIRWYDYLAWTTYLSYFFVPTLALAALWWRSRQAFRRLATMVVLLAFTGCTTYVLYPAVPPWLAGQEGLIPPVHHLFSAISGHMPWISFQPLWKKGTNYANLVAAIPSLHAGFTLLVTLFVRARLRSRARELLWLWPLAMAFALVYSGEHYVTDVLIGWFYAFAVYRLVEQWHGGPAAAGGEISTRDPTVG